MKLISPAELPFLSVRGMRRLCPLVMCDSGYCRQREAVVAQSSVAPLLVQGVDEC